MRNTSVCTTECKLRPVRAKDGSSNRRATIAAEAADRTTNPYHPSPLSTCAALEVCFGGLSGLPCVSYGAEPPLTLPLRDIVCWERYGKLECVASPLSLSLRTASLLRLTIDSDGISKVERFSCPSQHKERCSTSSAFIIVHVKSIDGVALHLKVRELDVRFLCLHILLIF